MRVLVTGGAGFIGSHLCDRLLDDGHEVVALDNFSTGRAENLDHRRGHPSLQVVCHDICEPVGVSGSFDWIFNLGSPASPRDYLAAPVETLLAGSYGTRNVLELARRDGAVFVQASTSETYGDARVQPQPESYWGHVNPIGPRSVYDESKRFSESLAMAYHREHGVQTRLARLFNTYGPRMKPGDGRVVPAFLEQVQRGEPLVVFGDGSQTRCLCYVSDIVDGLLRLAASGETRPVNLGSPDELTMLELACIVQEVAGVECGIQHEPLPQDDPKRRRPDIRRASEVLGWWPQVPLEDGLRSTLESMRVFQEQPNPVESGNRRS